MTATLTIGMLGLSVAIITDHLQILAKYFGAVQGRIATGYNLAMKVMVGNRVGAVLFFVLIGFNIDSGIAPLTLTYFILGTLALVALFNLVLVVWFRRRELAGPLTSLTPLRKESPVILASLFATTLNLLGLTVPFLLAASPNFG